jgi:uncharacterized protein (TIGR03382 family)
MLRQLVLASFVVVAGLVAAGDSAHANGRLPATSSITFRQGHDDDVVAGLTFGLVISHDGGKTWAWMCDDAIGISTSPYDPNYAYTPGGSVFATTLAGLAVMRDRCTFGPTPEGKNFVSAHAQGTDGAFYYGAAQTADTAHGVPADFKIYRSTDDGATFPQAVKPGDKDDVNVWWQSIAVAPSNSQVIYVSGYRFIKDTTGSGGDTVRDHLVFRSDDGGASWTPLPTTGFTLSRNSVIQIAAIDKDNAQRVYAKVSLIDLQTTDAIYVSSNAGVDWTEVHRQADRFTAVVSRAAMNQQLKHDLIAVTTKFGPEISHDDGATWEPITGAPHLSCLVENAAGELWGCTQNYGVGQTPSDDAGIMKTTDFKGWTKVLRYQDLTEAVSGCGADTMQQKSCAPMWCAVCAQLGCTPAASYACQGSEAPPQPPQKSGCCDAGGSGTAPLALALVVATVLLRPRRRQPR